MGSTINEEHTQQAIDCSCRETLGRLYAKMGRASAAKAYAMIGNMAIAKEIAQEVFMRLWQAQKVFPCERAVHAWIYKATHHAGIDYLRSASFRRELFGEHVVEHMVSFLMDSQAEERYEARQTVAWYLTNLPEREREILFYVVVDEMSHSEVAELLGISTKTVQRSLRNAQAQFRIRQDGRQRQSR